MSAQPQRPQGVSVKIAKLPRTLWLRFLDARPQIMDKTMTTKAAIAWILSPDEPEPARDPRIETGEVEGVDVVWETWHQAWTLKLAVGIAAGIQAGRSETYPHQDTRTATKPSTHIPAAHAEAVKDACGHILGVDGIGAAIALILCGIDPDFEAALRPRESK